MNCKGMSSTQKLPKFKNWLARQVWKSSVKYNQFSSWVLNKLNVHKQWANRPLDWCSYIEVLATANESDWWDFIMLREHPDAQPEMQELANRIRVAISFSQPRLIEPKYYYSASEVKLDNMPIQSWHMPFADRLLSPEDGITTAECLKVVTARCARLSYLTHDGIYSFNDDMKLHDRLMYSKHWSPFEHCAFPIVGGKRSRNFTGWIQYRALVDGRGMYSKS